MGIVGRLKNKWYRHKINDIIKKEDISTDIVLERFGNDYGGFSVCTDYIPHNAVVYSFGIGEDLSFSQALHDRFDVEIYAFDPTPKSKAYVLKHQLYNSERFHFEPIGLSDKNEDVQFYLPENEDWVSGSEFSHEGNKTKPITVTMEKLDTIIKKIGHKRIDLLKMDIEGLNDINIEINQICLEVHNRYFKDGNNMLKHMNEILHERGYCLVSISDSLEELTYINKKVFINKDIG